MFVCMFLACVFAYKAKHGTTSKCSTKNGLLLHNSIDTGFSTGTFFVFYGIVKSYPSLFSGKPKYHLERLKYE